MKNRRKQSEMALLLLSTVIYYHSASEIFAEDNACLLSPMRNVELDLHMSDPNSLLSHLKSFTFSVNETSVSNCEKKTVVVDDECSYFANYEELGKCSFEYFVGKCNKNEHFSPHLFRISEKVSTQSTFAADKSLTVKEPDPLVSSEDKTNVYENLVEVTKFASARIASRERHLREKRLTDIKQNSHISTRLPSKSTFYSTARQSVRREIRYTRGNFQLNDFIATRRNYESYTNMAKAKAQEDHKMFGIHHLGKRSVSQRRQREFKSNLNELQERKFDLKGTVNDYGNSPMQIGTDFRQRAVTRKEGFSKSVRDSRRREAKKSAETWHREYDNSSKQQHNRIDSRSRDVSRIRSERKYSAASERQYRGHPERRMPTRLGVKERSRTFLPQRQSSVNQHQSRSRVTSERREVRDRWVTKIQRNAREKKNDAASGVMQRRTLTREGRSNLRQKTTISRLNIRQVRTDDSPIRSVSSRMERETAAHHRARKVRDVTQNERRATSHSTRRQIDVRRGKWMSDRQQITREITAESRGNPNYERKAIEDRRMTINQNFARETQRMKDYRSVQRQILIRDKRILNSELSQQRNSERIVDTNIGRIPSRIRQQMEERSINSVLVNNQRTAANGRERKFSASEFRQQRSALRENRMARAAEDTTERIHWRIQMSLRTETPKSIGNRQTRIGSETFLLSKSRSLHDRQNGRATRRDRELTTGRIVTKERSNLPREDRTVTRNVREDAFVRKLRSRQQMDHQYRKAPFSQMMEAIGMKKYEKETSPKSYLTSLNEGLFTEDGGKKNSFWFTDIKSSVMEMILGLFLLINLCFLEGPKQMNPLRALKLAVGSAS